MTDQQPPTGTPDIAREAGIVDGREEFALLSHALADIARVALQPPSDERTRSAAALLVKFYAHTSSAFHLSQGTAVPTNTQPRLDMDSVFVLSRAAFEAFLRFHHIFVEPRTPEARECMYLGWQLASYRGRQRYPASLPTSKQAKAEEQLLIEQIEKKLSSNTYYQSLDKGERSRLRSRGQTKTWGDIALSAGLADIHADHWYRYLCGPAHAAWIDVARFAASNEAQMADSMCRALEVDMIAMALMLDAFVVVFPACRSVLTPEQAQLINGWKGIGTKLPPAPDPE